MREQFGLKDFAVFGLLACTLLLGVTVLLQKNHDAEVVMSRIDESRKDLDAVRSSLAETNTRIAGLVAALEKAAGAKAGPVDLSSGDLKTAIKNAGTTDGRPRGDWFVWALPAEPRTLNPLTARDLYARYVRGYGKVFQTLADYDVATMKLKGVLAESWTLEDDGKVITFKLRPEAKWSDGKPVTADDVVFSVETVKNPKIDCPDVRNYFEDLVRVEKIDDHTVRYHWRKKYFKSLEVAGDGTFIIPKHIYGPVVAADPEKFNRIRGSTADNKDDPVIGSGPYILERWDTGQSITLARNTNYWGDPPALDKMVFKFIKNEQAALQAFEKGEVDMIAPTPRQYDAKANDPEFRRKYRIVKFSSPLSGYSYVGYNGKKPLFADKRVRQALTMALDRELIIRDMWFNIGQVGYSPFYQMGPQTAPDLKPWPYDLERSRRLLAEAGWRDTDGDGILDKDGRKFAFKFLMTTDNKVGEEQARYLQSQFAKLGIKVELNALEWSSFLEKINNQDYECTALAWGGGSPENDPYQIWHSSQAVDRGSNFVSFINKRADELIEQARQELDTDKRNALYHEFHRILHEEQPYTFLVAREFVYFINPRFENVKAHPLRLEPLEWFVPPEKQKYKG